MDDEGAPALGPAPVPSLKTRSRTDKRAKVLEKIMSYMGNIYQNPNRNG